MKKNNRKKRVSGSVSGELRTERRIGWMCGDVRIWESERRRRRPVNVCEHAEKQMQTVFAAGKNEIRNTNFRKPKADAHERRRRRQRAEAPAEGAALSSADERCSERARASETGLERCSESAARAPHERRHEAASCLHCRRRCSLLTAHSPAGRGSGRAFTWSSRQRWRESAVPASRRERQLLAVVAAPAAAVWRAAACCCCCCCCSPAALQGISNWQIAYIEALIF